MENQNAQDQGATETGTDPNSNNNETGTNSNEGSGTEGDGNSGEKSKEEEKPKEDAAKKAAKTVKVTPPPPSTPALPKQAVAITPPPVTPPAPPIVNEKPRFADKTFAELPTTAMLCIEVESESFGTDKYTNRPKTDVKDNYIYQTKAYWLAVEKDADGVPRYMRAKLLGLAVKNEETGQYDGYLPFYDRNLL